MAKSLIQQKREGVSKFFILVHALLWIKCFLLSCIYRQYTHKSLNSHRPENPNLRQKDGCTLIGKFVGCLHKLSALVRPVRISAR